MSTTKPELVLIGGGHAHLGVLADWAKRGTPDAVCTLLTPDGHARYSGMLPGIVAGRYEPEDGLIDLEALAARSGTKVKFGRCVSIDPVGRSIATESGANLPFDICSIDTGGEGQATGILGQDRRLLDVRPIGTFLARLEQWQRALKRRPTHIVIAGGGAGGFEIAHAMRFRYREHATRISLVSSDAGLLSGFASPTRRLARHALRQADIDLYEDDLRIANGRVYAGSRLLEPVDGIIASFGARAPEWPRESGLCVDHEGFIAVDRHQRSVSHPAVFAAGDVARRMDRHVPHSGVHAVHTGQTLAHNLACAVEAGDRLHTYRPRPASLYLLATGQCRAIASYGPLAAHGRWAGWLKHSIDSRWIERFAKIARAV